LRSLDDGAGAVLCEIIDQYLAQAEQGRGELGRVISDGDAIALARAAHMLKGANANIGAAGLASICARIEALAATAPTDVADGGSASELIDEFDAEFARVRDALTLLMIAS
jgi:HPt (histidine-containing phosphotransfer) domain-containing protein